MELVLIKIINNVSLMKSATRFYIFKGDNLIGCFVEFEDTNSCFRGAL